MFSLDSGERIVMRTIFIVVMLCVLAAVLIPAPAVADETTHVFQTSCPGGIPLWLWVNGDDFDCSETAGVYSCTDTQYGNSSSATCSRGCEEVFSTATYAGCYFGDGNPQTNEPNFTVSCSNSRKFDLTPSEGDTCTQHDEGTHDNPKITGGECSQTGDDGVKHVSTSADCDSGCGKTQPGADCKER